MAADAPGSGDAGKCGATDLVLAIDKTFSMRRAIIEAKRESTRLIDLVSFVSQGDFRLGLISFRDHVDVDLALGAMADPASAAPAMKAAIRGLRAQGGQGGPEASDEALRTAIFGLPARAGKQTGDFPAAWQGRTRILVLITDALPGGFADRFTHGVTDKGARELAAAALARQIRISAVYIPSEGLANRPDPRIAEIMRNYARLTGGVFSITDRTGRGTAEAIAGIIDACGFRPIS